MEGSQVSECHHHRGLPGSQVEEQGQVVPRQGLKGWTLPVVRTRAPHLQHLI